MEKQENKRISKGNILVLLMVLAILAATVLPALTGYQKRIKQLELYQTCKDIQIAATEQAAKLIEEYGSADRLDAMADDILQQSGHSGSITGTILCQEPAEITYLAYQDANGNKIVYQDGSYVLGQDGIVRSARATMLKIHALQQKNDYLLTEEDGVSQLRQDIYSNGAYPSLSDAERNLLGEEKYRENWYWKPISTGEKVVLAAEANRTDASDAAAVLLYNGSKYYLPANGSSITLPAVGFDIDALEGTDWIEVELH